VVCQSCVDKLASKLVKNHPKLDLIRAKELSSKAVERVANREKPQKVIMIINGVEVDPDYTKDCVGGGVTACKILEACVVNEDCYLPNLCPCDCPDPEPHSHQTIDNCSKIIDCLCEKSSCVSGNPCVCSGTCGYECDEGYTWNGEECEPVAGKLLRRLLVGVGL